MSLLLHAANSKLQKKIPTQRRKGTKVFLCSSLASLRLCVRNILALVLDTSSFIPFLRDRLAGHTILALDPAAEIDKLAPLRTERTEGIIFPFGWLTAGWALHEFLQPRNGPQRIKGMRDA